MPREHEERPRRPPARKMTTDGMEERSENLGDTNRDQLDLRAGQQRLELGRNPRGAPVSVSEAIARYKEAQARKFSEHITKPRKALPADTKPAEVPMDTGVPATESRTLDTPPPIIPAANGTGEPPRAPSFTEARADYHANRRPPRLRFEEQPEGVRGQPTTSSSEQPEADASGGSGITGDETDPFNLDRKDDSPAEKEQPESGEDVPDGITSETDSALSHERESLLSHEPRGRLQHDCTPAVPVKPPKRKPVTLDGVIFVPEGKEQATADYSGDPSNPAAETDSEWRFVDDSPPEDVGTGAIASDAVSNADIELSVAAADVPAPDAKATTPEGVSADAAPDAPAKGLVESAFAAMDTGGLPGGDPAGATKKPGRERGSGQAGNKKDSKLKHDGETETPERIKSGRKLEKARNKAGRSSEKLQTAREKLPTKRKLRTGKEYDPEKGKMKPRLRFEKEVKTRRDHLKGPVAARPVKAGAGALIGYAHGKMHQVENDNVGVKAAHRGEMLAEGGARAVYRHVKTAPYRSVAKLERKTTKLNMKASYRQALHDYPELKKKPLSRMMQKNRIKRQYAKAAREAKRAGTATAKVAVKVKAFAAKVTAKAAAVLANPKVLLIIGGLLLIIVLLFGLISSCSNMFSGIGASVAGMSYVARDADVDGAELRYTELEADLRLEIQNAETTHGGYDEYRYNIGAIGHDPYVLMGFLTAVYQDFTLADIQPVLDALFNEQYQLTFTPSVEVRYRTECYDDSWTDEFGNSGGGTYCVEVPYDWHVLTVTLTSRTLLEVVTPRMDADQSQHYALLTQSKGLRQYVSSPFGFNWLPYVSSYYGYRVHPITGVKDYHLGVDVAPPAGTEILAAHGGTVTFAGSLGGYGNVVVIEDGAGLVTKYAHCDAMLVGAGQTVLAGDVIATVGNTGDSTGPHLHFEVIKDGHYLNPIYFSYTNSN